MTRTLPSFGTSAGAAIAGEGERSPLTASRVTTDPAKRPVSVQRNLGWSMGTQKQSDCLPLHPSSLIVHPSQATPEPKETPPRAPVPGGGSCPGSCGQFVRPEKLDVSDPSLTDRLPALSLSPSPRGASRRRPKAHSPTPKAQRGDTNTLFRPAGALAARTPFFDARRSDDPTNQDPV